MPFTIRTRTQWGAKPPTQKTASQGRPVEAFIHHSENPLSGRVLPLAKQDAAVRSIQEFHQQGRGWADIGYHFVVFPGASARTPRVYAARAVTAVPAAQGGHNTGTLAICLYGGGADPVQVHTRYLVEQLLRLYPSVRRIGTHRQVTPTSCPGDIVAEAVRTISRVMSIPLYAGGAGL